jgi:hypothetical protein
MPIPIETDTGWTYLVVVMEQQEQLGSGLPAIADVGFQATDGSLVWLSDFQIPVENDSQSPPAPETDETQGTPPPESGLTDPDA